MYKVVFNKQEFNVKTSGSLFSPNGADKGTILLLSHIKWESDDKLLDLGCGTGIVSLNALAYGVKPSNIYLSDIDELAVKIAEDNLHGNGFDGATFVVSDAFNNVTETDFSVIASNPPYHTDFKVAKAFIQKGFNRLKIGGRMYLVTKRKDWYKNKMISIFGGVRIYEEENGYFVFESIKRKSDYSSVQQKKKKNKLKGKIQCIML